MSAISSHFHWPYIVPEPYASMYGPDDVLPVKRHADERDNAHPVYAAMQQHRVSKSFRAMRGTR